MSTHFAAFMGISSALSLSRGFAVASVLTVEDFGVYAVLVAIGAFSSSLLGLGQIEGTMKSFPRVWLTGHGLQVCAAADGMARALHLRALAVVVVAVLVVQLMGYSTWAAPVFFIVAAASGTAAIGVYSSVVRAAGDLKVLSNVTLLRSLLALILVVIGALWAGGVGAMLGEVVSVASGAFWARREGRRLAGNQDSLPGDVEIARLELGSASGGRWLLGAMLATSLPLYLDRLFVVSVLGMEAAGQYGFLMLFVTGALTVAGIIVQKVGPTLVCAQYTGAAAGQQWVTALRWIVGQACLVVLGIGVAAVFVLYGPLDFLGRRFGLEPIHFVATAAIGLLQGFVLLDWILLSRDQERLVFVAAVLYLLLVLAMAVWCRLTLEVTLSQLIFGLALAKLAHVLIQCSLVALLSCRTKEGF